MPRTKLRDCEGAFETLAKLCGKTTGLEDGQWFLAREGRRVRIEEVCGSGVSIPFYHTWLTYKDFYEQVWFAVRALRIREDNEKS